MSTTLTNGLKLPDKGSVDWYADMQNNYAILDGAVGTIAEHTSALSGKAPLVHTHTKSDVTDLFNSANTWTADQTLTSQAYIKSPTWEKGVEPSSATHRNIYFVDKNNATVGTIRRRIANGSQSFQFFGSALVKNSQLDPTGDNVTWGFSQVFSSDGSTYFQFDGSIGNSIVPRANNSYDLGSSSYKWKTLNGINPGALSLPDTTREEPIDTTNWAYTYATANIYYPPEDGWLAVACAGSDYIQIDGSAGWGITLRKGYDGFCTGMIPVKKNVRTQIRIKETSSGSVVVRKASFYPGTGDPLFTVTPLNNS